jgi:uncharacterized protein (TIGR03118 family)
MLRMSSRVWTIPLLLALATAGPARADVFHVTTLVESPNFVAPPGFTGTGTPIIDPNLVNPWGMSLSGNSPLWVSNQAVGIGPGSTGVPTATLYRGFVNGSAFASVPLVVQIPPAGTPPFRFGPTGQVFSGLNSFTVSGVSATTGMSVTTPAAFIFAQRNGQVTGWAPNVLSAPGATPNTAIPINGITPTAGAAYTGLGLVRGSPNFLFAANNNSNSIDRFDGAGGKQTFTYSFTLANGSTAHAFNVQELSNGKLYATFSYPGVYGGAGVHTGGTIAILDPATGAVITSFTSQPGGVLNGPWGLAIAPPGFDGVGSDLLVGNFNGASAGLNGVIDIFDPNTLMFLGTLDNPDGSPIQIPGLWGLQFGNGTAGSPTTLFATGGGVGENEGVLVAITAVPEPGTFAVFVMAGAWFAALRRRRRRRQD